MTEQPVAWRCGSPWCRPTKSGKARVLALGRLASGSTLECLPCSCGWTTRFAVGLDGCVTTRATPAGRRAVVAVVEQASGGANGAESLPAQTATIRAGEAPATSV
jgi:hypothetical protein